MRRLLTGYVVNFNRRYKRHGQLFQNRYKSIICQEDIYLRELVRYIHLDLDKVEQRVLEIYQIERQDLYSKGRQRIRAEARGLFCYWAVRELGYGQAELGRRLGMTQPGVGYAVQRGEHIVKENNFLIEK
jgi:chromosomal replication initiation ATPase DnaA